MKVTDVKVFAVDCYRTNWMFVKVYTDEGLTGVGEATLEYKEQALTGAVAHIREYLTGKNPLNIADHWFHIYRDAYWRGGPVLMSALSAVETALWDILGKSLHVPVWQLLGGKINAEVPVYVNGWFAGAKTPRGVCRKGKSREGAGRYGDEMGPFRQGVSAPDGQGTGSRHRVRGRRARGGGQRDGTADRGARQI